MPPSPGPVVRGDITTIRAHIDALAAADVDDATVDAYLELARATAGRAEADGRLAPKIASDIRQVLDEADWDTMAADRGRDLSHVRSRSSRDTR